MKSRRGKRHIILFVIFCAIAFSPGVAISGVKGAFLYNLSNFTGTIPYNWARVYVDRERTEVYVVYQNTIRVFNNSGMEVYTFGDDTDHGHIADIAVDRNDDILLLTYREGKSAIVRCNFRGEPKSRVEIKNLPDDFSGFLPNRMVYRNGNLYIASLGDMKVIITDLNGNFKGGYNLKSLISLDEEEKRKVEEQELDMSGFSVDNEGNMLFTIPVLFKVFKITPDRKMTFFGKPGGAPGRFGIVAGIITDNKGNYVVVDKLKCAVIVFDKNLNFVTEFGYRGPQPDNLIAPNDIAIDKDDKIYVTQSRKRGVSVFRLTYD